MTLLVYQTDLFTDVTVNWDSQAVQTCRVTSSANHVVFGWWQNSSRSVYFASQGKTGVYIYVIK